MYKKGSLIIVREAYLKTNFNIYFNSNNEVYFGDCIKELCIGHLVNGLRLDLNKFSLEHLGEMINCAENNGIYENKELELLAKEYARIIVNNSFDSSARESSMIYEEIKTKDGSIYGREIVTGKIFPVNISNKFSHKITPKLIIFKKTKEEITLSYRFTINYDFIYPSMDKVKCFIKDEGIVDDIEVTKYRKKHNKFLNLKYRDFASNINYYCSYNVFNELPIPYENIKIETKEKELVKKDIILDSENVIMENIEYLLCQLEYINYEKYLEFQNEYNKLLESNSDYLKLFSLDTTSLVSLESKIELEIKYSKRNAKNITEYLDNYRIEYLNNILVGDKTEIDFKNLDNFLELFIKVKNDYSICDRRVIINKIAFLYLMEIFENREFLNEELLSKTHCDILLKSMITNLRGLIKSEVFYSNLNLELIEDININNVLEIIRNIEIKDREKVIKLIKQ